jgi:rSAM/selenodomain-associated transferase 1
MFHYPNTRLLVFSKSPQLGCVKTRMQPTLPINFSIDLHKSLINYCLSEWLKSNVCPIDCWVAGDMSIFQETFSHKNLDTLYQQEGQDLGERMFYAADSALINNEAVILVGTDCPFIDVDYLLSACKALKSHDVVIGPAEDGGYVLLGLKVAARSLFDGISWGQPSVFEDTIKAINALGLSSLCLPRLSDIDYPEDLKHLSRLAYFHPLLERWNVAF